MNQALHFAWWLTVPGSDEEFIQLYAVGASPVKRCDATIGPLHFNPKPGSQLYPNLPAIYYWKNNRRLYSARVTFEDGSVVEPLPLDMRTLAFETGSEVPAEHRQHVVYRGRTFTRPLIAVTPFDKAAYDLWVTGCTFDGGGVANIDQWFPGWRRVYVTGCTFRNCMSGPQGNNVELVRDVQLENIGGDALSDARVVWNARIDGHARGRADLHPDTYQFRSRGPQVESKLIAGVRDYSTGSQGIFADRTTPVLNTAIVRCHIGTDGVGAAFSLENRVENLLIDSCNFIGPRRIEGSRSNVMIRNTPGVS